MNDPRFEHPVFNDCDYSWDVIYLNKLGDTSVSFHDMFGGDDDDDDDDMEDDDNEDNNNNNNNNNAGGSIVDIVEPLLQESFYNNYDQVYKLIVNDGHDVNVRYMNGCTPLICSIIGLNNHIDNHIKQQECLHIIQLLIHHGADINYNGCYGTPLSHATARGLYDVVLLLLHNGALIEPNPNVNETTPLHYACRNHHISIIQLLLKYGANVNYKNHVGCTPLHVAVSKKKCKMTNDIIAMIQSVQILLHYKANIYTKTNCGLSPIEISFYHQHIPILIIFQNEDTFIKRQLLCQYISNDWLRY